jgi:hypothetical protein
MHTNFVAQPNKTMDAELERNVEPAQRSPAGHIAEREFLGGE